MTSNNFFQVFSGSTTLTQIEPGRSGTVAPFGADGTLLVFDSRSPWGYIIMTAAEVVTLGIEQGAIVQATSISLLTSPGQLLSSNGLTNVVVPPGTNGQILRINMSNADWLEWTDPSAAAGVGLPTPDTLVQRGGTGQIYAAGFIANDNILPAVAGTQSVGTALVPFAAMNATSGTFGGVVTPQVSSASGACTINGATSTVLAVGGVTALTASATSVLANLPLVAGQLVVGTGYQATNSWRFVQSGAELWLQYWNGSSYVTKQVFGAI